MAALTIVRMNPISSNMSTTAKSAGCDREEDEATGGGEVGVREGSGEEMGSSAAVRWQGEVSLVV